MLDLLYILATDKYKGFVPVILKFFLLLLSFVYGLAIRILILFFRFQRYRLNCKVISVGNITLGGTGKTSLIEYLAGFLRQNGHRVAILTRGYRRHTQCLAQDAQRSYEHMGDEPYMLSQKLGEIPVMVDKNRIRAAKEAIKKYGADTAILDDGFQQWRLKKDLEIVTIDATNPFGNKHILPRGILREPISSLKRADIFILTKTNLNSEAYQIRDLLTRINPQAEIFMAVHRPLGFYILSKPKELLDTGIFKGKSAVLFSGIGDPDSFENLIKSLSIAVNFHYRFRDHHHYNQEDLENIITSKNTDVVITTEKDAARLQGLQLETYSAQLFVLRIELTIIKNEAQLHSRLLRLYSL